MIIKYEDKKNKFIEMFNSKTGFYLRTGVIDENGKDTGVDPFMRNFPGLLDVGIMGSCLNAKNGTCKVQCYQGGSSVSQANMSIENFKKIVEQCKGKCFQFALGGRGDVNKHESFREILELCNEYNIVPNYTTSGLHLTDEEVNITKKHVGAIAVSAYDLSENGYSTIAINKFVQAGVKTNIHYVLGNNSIDDAINRLKTNNFPEGINAVVFLLHKPVGLGQESNVLQFDDPRVKEFYELIDNNKFKYKIGFDSCNVPALLNFTKNINSASWDTCEGGRYSAYITSDMKFLPCSFDNRDERWAVDLNKYSIQEAWDSDTLENFRDSFRNSCPSCKDRQDCLGGCPIKRNIVLCNKDNKDLK